MCILCVRTGTKLAHGLLSRLGTPAWLQQGQEAGLRLGGARFFASLPEPVEQDAKAHAKDGYVLHPDLLNANLKKTQVGCLGKGWLSGRRRSGPLAREVICYGRAGVCHAHPAASGVCALCEPGGAPK